MSDTIKVRLSRENEKIHFVGEDEGNSVSIDGPPEMGGEGKGHRPTQLLLYAVGSCAAFDFATMLYKNSIEIEDLLVEIEGQRRQEGAVNPFGSIAIQFILIGDSVALERHRRLILDTARRAVYELCSIGATLRKETSLRFSVEIRAAD